MATKKEGGKNRKYGRNLRKKAASLTAISSFIRGKISGEQYFKLSGKRR